MVDLQTRSYLSTEVAQLIPITDDVEQVVAASSVKNGLVAVIVAHTTCGIVVNEGLPCVERDLGEMLERMVPLDAPYAHAHFLRSYGATGNNSQGHLKSTLVGNSCMFPLIDGKMQRGGAQEIYLAEFDGPQRRRVFIELIGDGE
jgi:secondary thiamine-phosphate synthase enzyme